MAQKKNTKIHLEVAGGNWKRLEVWLDSYNEDPRRLTPRLKLADVVNEALVEYLIPGESGVPSGR